MIKVSINFCIILVFCLVFSGCFYVISGAVGVLGGYAISRDTIQGEIDIPFGDLWFSSVDVLDVMGVLIAEDQAKGLIEAKVNGAEVKVTIYELTSKTARLRVSARKYMLPQINLAQKIYIKAVSRAK